MNNEWTKEQNELWNEICTTYTNEYSDACYTAIENGEITSTKNYEEWLDKMNEENKEQI